MGGSNGGLSDRRGDGNQRPELFGVGPAGGRRPRHAALPHRRAPTPTQPGARATTGWSENEDEFRALLAYSPYHNIREDHCYPPTWITTADHDDRVVPWHSFKYAARLQSAQPCEDPILLRIETRAGHGAGKPTWMQIEEVANAWAFLADSLRFVPFGTD